MSDKPTLYVFERVKTRQGEWHALPRHATRAELLAAVGLDGIDVEELRQALRDEFSVVHYHRYLGAGRHVTRSVARKVLAALDGEEETVSYPNGFSLDEKRFAGRIPFAEGDCHPWEARKQGKDDG